MLTISAHKFGGPKGVGVLYIKDGVKLHRENIGGAQERNLRAGTYNTPGIVGLGKAINELRIKNYELRIKKITKLRDYMIDKILKEIPDTFLNGDRVKRNPNNVNISFKYIEGEAILLHLDRAGIATSSGSACTSGSLDPSHVLLAIGLKHEDAHGSIRFTLGDTTTKEDIDYTISILKKTARTLRSMSPFGE
jgi:cysteine desulfurase